MIQYLRRKEIDIDKYDNCIQNASNSRIYALSYYLDIVADNWDALVLNDYEAVMPLPWRSKYFIRYIYTPCWTQQLGVFSIPQLSTELIDQFTKAIPKKFLKTSIYFNSQSQPSSFVQKRDNYILDLNESYENLYKNYRKDRKDRLKKFLKSNATISTDTEIKKLIDLFKVNYRGKTTLDLSDYNKLEILSQNDKIDLHILKIHNSNNKLISGSLFLKDKQRIYYLFSANNKEGNKAQGNTAILNKIIQKYSETNYILDFEGSMIPGISSFFKSFGSHLEYYYLYVKRL